MPRSASGVQHAQRARQRAAHQAPRTPCAVPHGSHRGQRVPTQAPTFPKQEVGRELQPFPSEGAHARGAEPGWGQGCPLRGRRVPAPSSRRPPQPRDAGRVSADCSLAAGPRLPPGHEPGRHPALPGQVGSGEQSQNSPGCLYWGGTDRSPQAPRDRNQAALQAGKWESAPAASGDNRNFGNDSKRRRISPPSAAGLGNVRLSVGFVGAVLLPLLPPARSGRGAGNQNPPQPLQTKPQTTRSTLSPGSAQQLEAPTGSWGDPAVPEGIWVSAGLAALLAAPGHSAILVGPRSMGRWQRTKSEFSHLQ